MPDSGAHFSAGVRSAVKEAVDVPPNNYWKLVGWHYPFPLGLWVYNNWPRAEKGFKHWIYEKLVEDPVLISDVSGGAYSDGRADIAKQRILPR